MNYETDLSTQQSATQKNFWISGEDEDLFREKNHQPPSESRKEKTRRLSLPKEKRLLKRGEFLRVSKMGKRIVGRYLCLDYRPARTGRLGISAPCRYGSAPERNRFKRLVREAYRHLPSLPLFELNIVPRQCAKSANLSDIRDEMITLLKTCI